MKNGKLIKILTTCLLLCMFACGCSDAGKEKKTGADKYRCRK